MNDTRSLSIGSSGVTAPYPEQNDERDNPMTTPPKAFTNPRAADKVQLILDFILQHPNLARPEVLAWATQNLGIAHHTAEIYLRQAQKRYLVEQQRCIKSGDPSLTPPSTAIDSPR
jgi:hypothetical protein